MQKLRMVYMKSTFFSENIYTERTLWDVNFFVYLILVFLQQKIDLSDFLIQLSNEKLLCL